MCANCEAINGPASRRMAQSSIVLDAAWSSRSIDKVSRKASILGALRGIHKGIKRMGGMIKTMLGRFC